MRIRLTSGRAQEAGFSLLETIAAILLLGVAFGAVMHVASAATQLTSHAREIARVGMWADKTLDVAGRGAPLHVGTQDGRYDTRHRWRLAIAAVDPVPGHRADLHLYRLDLDISWHEGTSERHEHFATMRVQDEPPPPPADAVPTDRPPADAAGSEG